jgi:NAD(P)H-hydrate epimerase
MSRIHFLTSTGTKIPAVTEQEMREVDRLAVEEYQLGVLQMMENAGRNLALLSIRILAGQVGPIVILAGSGGNGGGGLSCARHLRNRGYTVQVLLSKPDDQLEGPTKAQFEVLRADGIHVSHPSTAEEILQRAALIVDALIGYSLSGAPSGESARLIACANATSQPIISLDLPSGMDATSGKIRGISIQSSTTLTLALPKTGLQKYRGDLYLGDIGIPPSLYQGLGFEPPTFPGDDYYLPIHYGE